jgi:hypothetical protein
MLDDVNEEELNDRQRRFVEFVASGLSLAEAARHAGFSGSYARKANRVLMKHPAIASAIARIRMEGRKLSAYGLSEAMREAEAVCAFAKLHKNAMAYCKGTELRAKLSGLLIDHVVVATVDLTGALARAETRLLKAIDSTPRSPHGGSGPVKPVTPLPLPSNGSTRWAPHIAGDDEPEAGPVEGESVRQMKNGGPESQ